jgi:MATE family multidrug resistance protein
MGMAVVDVMVVGQIAPIELPHQALGWAPIVVLIVTGIGLLTGVQVLAARGLGAGNPEEAGAAWRRGMVVSLVAGIAAVLLIWLLGERIFTVFGIAPALAQPWRSRCPRTSPTSPAPSSSSRSSGPWLPRS